MPRTSFSAASIRPVTVMMLASSVATVWISAGRSERSTGGAAIAERASPEIPRIATPASESTRKPVQEPRCVRLISIPPSPVQCH